LGSYKTKPKQDKKAQCRNKIIKKEKQEDKTHRASFVFGGFGGLFPSRSDSKVFINSVSVWEY